MKLHQKSINVKLDSNLSNELFNYLQSTTQSEAKSFTELIRIGILVKNGTYHDQKLNELTANTAEILRSLSILNKHQEEISQGLADLQDIQTGQISDIDLLTTPVTNRTQRTTTQKKEDYHA